MISNERSAMKTNSPFFTVRRLPDAQLNEEWERILVAPELKARMLRYLRLLAVLRQRKASTIGLALRSAFLLYGPPGCGKTSLARSLPNQWATLEEEQAYFLQINANALASAERGGTQKNVGEMFAQIGDVASVGLPTFALFDEAETIVTDRASISAETNPMDTLYGVNAFIEGADALLCAHPNVVLLYTSNLPRAIDRAVFERVDFSLLVPLPDAPTRQLILLDALHEVRACGFSDIKEADDGQTMQEIVRLTEGISARQLRHLVLSALAYEDVPTDIRLCHLLQVAADHAREQTALIANKGVYTHDFQR